MALQTGGEISSSVLQRVTRYVPLGEGEELLFLCHDSVFGTGKAGLLVTDQQVVSYNKSNVQAARYDEIESVTVLLDPMGSVRHHLRISCRDGRTIQRLMIATGGQMKQIHQAIERHLPSGSVDAIEGADEAHDHVLTERRLHRGSDEVILTTTPTIEGKQIVEHLGVVAGEVVLGVGIFRDFEAGIADVLGGRSYSYELELCDGREIAFRALEESASNAGANAVVGIDIDYETVGNRMLMISVNGTAVIVE